jgi:carbamoyl-phosphate synthase large subunit
LNILVTGIAGDIGNGIGRILRDSGLITKLIGCDIHDQHMGRFIFDTCKLVPKANEQSYTEALLTIAKEYDVDAIVPTSEPELRFFLKQGISQYIDGMPLVMPNMKALEVGFDKLKTADFLAKHSLPFPWTTTVAENEPKELPCIMKSRFGAGSQEVRLINDYELVPSYRKIFPENIWQECVGTADEEYTCGLYRSMTGEVRSIVFRRRLSAGITTYGEVVANPEINYLCLAIAAALELNGSINVQLRLTSRGPIVFEINPRFSSTVAFRHKLGFEDVIWSISEKLYGTLPPYDVRPVVGTKIFRKFEEVILFEAP